MTRSGEKETIFAERALFPDGTFAPASLRIEDGRIEAVARGERVEGGRTLPAGHLLAPGFLDLQVNGGGGVLFNDDPSPTGLARTVAAHRAGGTTGLLATVITDAPGAIGRAADAVEAAIAGAVPGVLGLHAEGPFISPRRPGVHPAASIRRPSAMDEAAIAAIAARMPLLLTVAPEEVAPAILARWAAAGAVISAGHTEADASAMAEAEAAGLRGATHLWNAMPPLASRAPGPVGAVLASGALFAGVIADGVHVDPSTLLLTWRLLGAGRMFLVTDAMPVAGTALDGFTLLGRAVCRRGGRLETTDGVLAGADILMADAVRHAVGALGAPLADALRMASETPARLMGWTNRGRIGPGMAADLVVLGPGLEVRATAIGGAWEEHGAAG